MPLNMKNLTAAVKEVKANTKERKFSQSIDLAINLQNIDMKKPEVRINTIPNIFVSVYPTSKRPIALLNLSGIVK